MSLWSPQWIFCNACGRRFLAEIPRVIGREWKVCSIGCSRAFELKRARSILGEPDELGFRESAALWFAGGGRKIRSDLLQRELSDESETWWLLTGGEMGR